MPRNRLPRVMKHYSPTGRRNHGRPLKRLLDTWDRNGSTSGPTAWQIYDVRIPFHFGAMNWAKATEVSFHYLAVKPSSDIIYSLSCCEHWYIGQKFIAEGIVTITYSVMQGTHFIWQLLFVPSCRCSASYLCGRLSGLLNAINGPAGRCNQ